MPDSLPWTIHGDALRLALRVTPRAKRSGFGDIVPDADGRPLLVVRLAAPPVDGAANKALVVFLARALGVGRSQVRILSGETSRRKLVEVTGVSTAALSHRLETRPG